MNDDRAARAALRLFLVTHMQDTHHEDGDGCYDGAEAALLDLEARSEGPGLDWRAKIAAAEEWIGWDSTFCYWCDNDQSEGHAPDCVWVAAQENPEAS